MIHSIWIQSATNRECLSSAVSAAPKSVLRTDYRAPASLLLEQISDLSWPFSRVTIRRHIFISNAWLKKRADGVTTLNASSVRSLSKSIYEPKQSFTYLILRSGREVRFPAIADIESSELKDLT